jgi:hypothetical protein
MPEVIAHQLFDTLTWLGAGVAEYLGGALLQLVTQDVLVPSALQVKGRPHSQQEILGIIESRRISRTTAQQQRIGEERDRARRREVSERARCVLYVRLQLVERAVELRVAVVDERDERAQDKCVRLGLMEKRAETLKHRPRPGDGTRVEEREEKLRIVPLQLAEVLDVANLMPHYDTEIPEGIQEAVDEPFFRGPDAAAKQQQQVDVGMQAEMTPAVASKGDNGQRPIVDACVGEQLSNERIDPVGIVLERRAAARSTRDGRAQFLPRGVKRRLEPACARSVSPPRRRAIARRRARRSWLRHRHGGNILGLRTII